MGLLPDRERSRRYDDLRREYTASMDEMSDREEKLKGLRKGLEELGSEFDVCSMQVERLIGEQVAAGSLPRHFDNDLYGIRLLREEQLLELDEEKDRLRLELDKIRGTMEKLDIEYARDICRLDEGLGKGAGPRALDRPEPADMHRR